MTTTEIYTKELCSDLWPDFEAYFEFGEKRSGCWCMNHRLPIGLDFKGEAAKSAMKLLVESNRVFGILAYVEGEKVPVGWSSLDRKKTLPGHDCIEEDINCNENIWSIHCTTVRADHKNSGVETILISACVELAKKKNAVSVEAYPEPGSVMNHEFKTWNSFNGYQSEFERQGFMKVNKSFGSHEEFYYPMIKKL